MNLDRFIYPFAVTAIKIINIQHINRTHNIDI